MITQRKCGADAYLIGGSGKTLKRINNAPHPYEDGAGHHSIIPDDEYMLSSFREIYQISNQGESIHFHQYVR